MLTDLPNDGIEVLLIDDDRELTGLLSEYLVEEGFRPACVHSGREGVTAALSGQYDIVVLDIMMPHLNGIEVLRRIRGQSDVPVLMLTARGDSVDRITGLDLGADDYLAKPCAPGELVSRLRAILRRTLLRKGEAAQAAIRVGGLVVDPARREARWRGSSLDLTGTEFNILEVLARNAGTVVSRADLSRQALGRDLAPYDRSIDVHVSSIRQKMGRRPGGQSYVEGVRRLGYQLIISE
jgi:two-component system, OmpR family, response regulator